MIPAAKEMALAIRSNTQKLVNAEILEVESLQAASALYASLMRQAKNNHGWEITVDREYPFIFKPVTTEKNVIYRPTVSVDRIVTSTVESNVFERLDLSLQMACENNKNFARWHFDRANSTDGVFQNGPLYHLQFGGHMPNQSEDFWVKEPRWAHAPMDLILLLEVVAANFYTRAWTEKVRRDPTWCNNVSQSERMCMTAYLKRVHALLNVSSDTVLSGLWANV